MSAEHDRTHSAAQDRFKPVLERCRTGCAFMGDPREVPCATCPSRDALTAATSSPWDYADVYDGPWYVFREPRDEHRLAIKSGHYTILTVGDYFDGGGLLQERLEWICETVNQKLSHENARTLIAENDRLIAASRNGNSERREQIFRARLAVEKARWLIGRLSRA